MPHGQSSGSSRRDFLKTSVAAAGLAGAGAEMAPQVALAAAEQKRPGAPARKSPSGRAYNAPYTGEHLNRIAFPMGGMGAGMVCLEGTGAFSHVSLRHQPEVFNEPAMFAALYMGGTAKVARVLEGPVPRWKVFGMPGSGNGLGERTYGLPRFRQATFETHFPAARITLEDPDLPVKAEIVGWSPFVPGDADSASLPVAGLEYTITNRSGKPLDLVFSFNAKNFMGRGNGPKAVKAAPRGFVLYQGPGKDAPHDEGAFCVSVTDAGAKSNLAWFRGGWFDPLTIAWKDIAAGAVVDKPAYTQGDPSPGASVFVPLSLKAGERKTVTVQFAWYVGRSSLRIGKDPQSMPADQQVPGTYTPWYAGRFAGIEPLAEFWAAQYEDLRKRTIDFADRLYDTTLPAEVTEAVAANLTILKSPTVLRQADGRLWAYEGCSDNNGCCHGSCTHVWNYAQAIPHLFPALERTLRETEFTVSQSKEGHQTFRASLPIRQPNHDFHAAADGQLGGIMKAHREWRISGDTAWLKKLWPKIRQSLDFCIEHWDPGHKGILEEPHHNTYDIEFWGPDGMCTSFYLGALAAADAMAQAVGEPMPLYHELLGKGRQFIEAQLYNGEYFFQKVQWTGLKAKSPLEVQGLHSGYSPEAIELLKQEGPKYQYGNGCLSDGVLGAWMAEVCGVPRVMDDGKVASHLRSVHKYNLKHDLSDHVNPQRPSFACGAEGGLLLCTWPKGGALSLPFVYSNEVWTGIEYQVAAHLMVMGLVEEGLDIVRVARDRYDGRSRNPFNEYECGHWYARAMSSYGMIEGLTGARYDAVDKTLYLAPRIHGDFRAFLATADGYGTVGVHNGRAFVEGIEIDNIKYTPFKG